MSDAQVIQLFQKNSDTHCIRAFASQLNRPINLPLQEPTRFYRIAVALGLTLVMAAAADTYARPRPPLVEQHYLLGDGDTTKKETVDGDTLAIRGVVLDETNNPFPGVVVKVMQGGLIKGGTVTKDDGSFEIVIKERDINNYQISVSTVGYNNKVLHISKKDFNTIFSIKMNSADVRMMGALLDISPLKLSPELQKPLLEPPGRKTYNAKDLKNFGL
ncbi:MAG: carboxypeptidase-like regulatory domain-containing protein [Bacteroidota bacterium]